MSFLPYFSAETWTLLALLIALIVVYGYWPYGVFTKMGIPGPKPLPYFGTMMEYRKGFTNFDTECFQKYGRIWGIYDGRQPVLCIMDKSMIKTVLIKECYNIFTNRRNIILSGELFDAVSLAEDDTWRRIRSVLSPSFTSGRLKEMFGIMKQHSANLLNGMKKQADKDQAIEVKEFFGPYSMDVVTSTAFSVEMDSLNNPSDPFVSNVKKMIKFDLFNPLFLLILLFPFTGPILEKMKFSFFPTAVLDFFYASLAKIKSGRDTGNSTNRVDFLQLMIDSQKGNDTKTGEEQTKGLTDHEILSQAMIFIFGGYETSSTTMSFLAYNLATNPHTLTKLQEEIDTVFPNKAPIQYEALMQMDYLDCVLNESLRLYPIVPRLDRVAKKTVEINGIVIPKDCVVLVPTWTLHRDPEIWSDPEEFKPERFSKENKESIDPYTYMPFGAGPRNCIGMRFALIMIKLAMVEILQSFTFSVCDETEIPLEMDIQGLLMPKRPIKLRLEPRSNTPSNTTATSKTGPLFSEAAGSRTGGKMMSFLPYFSAETWTLLALLITLIVVIYDGRQPVLCIMDQSLIKTVLIKECYNTFTNRRNLMFLSGEMFDAVSVAEDDTWRRIRSVLSPSFTSGRLKEMFRIMKQHSANLLNGMKKQADKDQTIEVKEFFGPYSMDVVTSTAFSVDIDSLNNPSDPFVSNVKKLLKFDLFNPLFLLVVLFPFIGPILEKMKFSFFPTAVMDFFYASLAKIKSGRDTGNSTNRVDFLQLMIDSQKGSDTKTGEEQTKGLTDHEILSQAIIFIFAGYETSSRTMSFLAYNLATNPHVMTKLQEEIDTVFPNKAPIQYEALMQMDYLDCVLNESLRLYPVSPRLERVAKKTVEINGIVIPKDCVVMVPTWTLHRDPEIWSDPEEFKPERFSKENKESIDPYTYMPFGAGPRNCIGMRFALIMIKLAMVEILQSFTFSVCDETEIPLEMDIQGMMMPKQPIKLRLEPRSNITSNTTTTSLKS
ncbi:cytochrome P450 3A27-like [Salvelinus alpinus]